MNNRYVARLLSKVVILQNGREKVVLTTFFNPNRDDFTIGADLAKAGSEKPGDVTSHYSFDTLENSSGRSDGEFEKIMSKAGPKKVDAEWKLTNLLSSQPRRLKKL